MCMCVCKGSCVCMCVYVCMCVCDTKPKTQNINMFLKHNLMLPPSILCGHDFEMEKRTQLLRTKNVSQKIHSAIAYVLQLAEDQAMVDIKSIFQPLCAAAYENAVFCDRGKRGLLFFTRGP